jgi:hypothetical protein
MKNTNNLQYYILPGNASGQTHLLEKYNQVYEFWKNIWTDTLQKMNLPTLEIAHFLRHNYVCAIFDKDQVVACHLYTHYDIRVAALKESEYFSQFATELIDHCRSRDINTIMTQEYMSAAPEYRKTVSQISIPEVIVGLGMHVMHSIGADSTGGTVRAGAPSVERVCKEINCELLDKPIMRYNIPHKFFIGSSKKVKLAGSTETINLIKNLWENRINYTIDKKSNDKIAA